MPLLTTHSLVPTLRGSQASDRVDCPSPSPVIWSYAPNHPPTETKGSCDKRIHTYTYRVPLIHGAQQNNLLMRRVVVQSLNQDWPEHVKVYYTSLAAQIEAYSTRKAPRSSISQSLIDWSFHGHHSQPIRQTSHSQMHAAIFNWTNSLCWLLLWW